MSFLWLTVLTMSASNAEVIAMPCLDSGWFGRVRQKIGKLLSLEKRRCPRKGTVKDPWVCELLLETFD